MDHDVLCDSLSIENGLIYRVGLFALAGRVSKKRSIADKQRHCGHPVPKCHFGDSETESLALFVLWADFRPVGLDSTVCSVSDAMIG